MPKLKPGTIIPSSEEDARITEAAHADPDARPLTDGEWDEVRATLEVGRRGPQRAPKKVLLSVRYSREVVEYFKATGDGWQTRMNDVLEEYVLTRK